MSSQRSGFFLGGLLAGGAIGTVVGLLIAPRSGKETRKLLQKSADALPELLEDVSSSLQIHRERLSESTQQSWQDTLDRLKDAIAVGLEASQQHRQSLEKNGTALEFEDAEDEPTPVNH
ncbi:YtxH domain-containing protein [Candidatus Synechococcus calcipolaris G9]|uniref:YtxH domain-containing protein n=1 Tax=Candidatus Synechococcus calcipolaris G9 TaxID=1497997 RepID=A0ABT6F0D7_9SYNE|nr:YtxH domain-containing protein [Candidatus Synechococcus calcipolaris]MDG2991326.1 YtxH domain-containing protein [Candidatus Synechococcus calcipolaris G9]